MEKLVTVERIQGAAFGYLLGLGVSMVIAVRDLERNRNDAKRAVTFANNVVEEAWLYLPADVKDKFQTEIQFYNISVREDL